MKNRKISSRLWLAMILFPLLLASVLFAEEQQRNEPLKKSDVAEQTLDFLSKTQIGGFLSSSFSENVNKPAADTIVGRTFDTNNNQFAFNKFVLHLEKPVEASGKDWDTGFNAKLLVGQDATVLHSTGLSVGPQGDLYTGYLTLNIPVGNGLIIKMGKDVTLMGLEVIDEPQNPNWSEGNQFLFVENFTATGVKAVYVVSPLIDLTFLIANGWDAVQDNNKGKSFMGRIGITSPNKAVNLAMLGYAGPEEVFHPIHRTSGIEPGVGGWIFS